MKHAFACGTIFSALFCSTEQEQSDGGGVQGWVVPLWSFES